MILRNSLAILLSLLSLGNATAQTCGVNVTSMAFGTLEADQGAAIDSTGILAIKCDAQVSYVVRLDAGRNSSGDFRSRKMRLINNSETLEYNLYRDSARTQIWGDGTGGSLIVSGVNAGTIQNITIYGSIFSGQNLHVGSYADAVTVIVEW